MIFRTALLLLFVLSGCVPLETTTSSGGPSTRITLELKDRDYREDVGLVWFNYNRPLIRLDKDFKLELSFDLLGTEFTNLQAKLIHCNRDWTRSVLQDFDFLDGFNQFRPAKFEYSTNTRSKYIQYRMELPCPKISGNYVLVLHAMNNEQDVYFTRRFVVYEELVSLTGRLKTPAQADVRKTHQEVTFEMNYGSLNSPNPMQNFQAVILQNLNWDQAIYGLPPTQIRPDQSSMVWAHINSTNTFPGWNQFRFADITTLNVRGFNVRKMDVSESRTDAYLTRDASRKRAPYSQLITDRNGGLVPVNSDPGESQLESDYAYVHFELESDQINGDVFLTGRFNNWKRSEKMQYNTRLGAYTHTLFLKQGIYDYRYETNAPGLNPWHFEGSHFQADNNYDILIYYRDISKLNDEVVGRLSMNGLDFF